MHVLVVEDNAGYTRILQERLKEARGEPFIPHFVDRLSAGVEYVRRGGIDVVLLDLVLPDAEGLEAFLRMQSAAPHVPIVVLTVMDDEQLAEQTVCRGAQDYLVKSELPPRLLVRALHYAVERKRAEQTLRWTAAILDSSDDAIVAATLDGRILSWNPGAERLCGYTAEEARGAPVSCMLPPERLDELCQIFERIRRGEHVQHFETEWITKEGRKIDVSLTVSPVKEASGAVVAASAVARDITEHKRAERSLQLTQFSVDRAADAAFWIDSESRFFYVNDAACRSLGYSREELLCMRMSDIVPDDQEGRNDWGETWRALKQSSFLQFEGRHRAKDGSVFPVEIAVNYLQFSGKEYCFAFARDIRKRKRAEQALRKSDLKYRCLFENSSDAVVIVRPGDEVILEANPRACEIYGLARQELLGKSLKQFTEDVAATERMVSEALSRGRCRDLKTVHVKNDGTRIPILAGGSRIEFNGEVAVLAIGRDISDLVRAEQLQEQFQQSQKLQAIGQLAAGVAHDFNNLLLVISSSCDLMMERLQDQQPMVERVQTVLHAAERGAALTQQLLAFSRKQVLAPKTLDLNRVLTEITALLERVLEANIQLKVLPGADLGWIQADPGQLHQVIMNLAVNARDAMPQGGKLVIETANVDLDRDYSQWHHPLLPGRYVMLAVSDTGCGIDRETQARIFEPFFTTKKRGSGTGLGLATVYGIVKQSGGYIWVYSEPGRGTTFKIYLPRVDAVEDKIQPLDPVQNPCVATGTVLLVEDADDVRESLREFLGSRGYTVLAAANGQTAFEIARQNASRIDFVITDIVMPGISGLELVARLERLGPNTKLIFMTGYTDEAVFRGGDLPPGTRFLQKPFALSTLARTLEELASTPEPIVS